MSERNVREARARLSRKELQPGEEFGRLVVVEHLKNPETGKRTQDVRVSCSCGSGERTVKSKDLRSGNTRSCGCLKKERVQNLQKNRQSSRSGYERNQTLAFRRYLKWYKRNADLRELEWHLEENDFRNMTSKPCHYCGTEPKKNDRFAVEYLRRFLSRGTKACQKTYDNKIIYVNGIDRINSTLPYVLDNCVPCCKDCNLGKHIKSKEEFLEWVRRVWKYNQ